MYFPYHSPCLSHCILPPRCHLSPRNFFQYQSSSQLSSPPPWVRCGSPFLEWSGDSGVESVGIWCTSIINYVIWECLYKTTPDSPLSPSLSLKVVADMILLPWSALVTFFLLLPSLPHFLCLSSSLSSPLLFFSLPIPFPPNSLPSAPRIASDLVILVFTGHKYFEVVRSWNNWDRITKRFCFGNKAKKWLGKICLALFEQVIGEQPSEASWAALSLTLKVLVVTIDAQWEGMGDVGLARYEPALLPPCPTIRVLSYSN